MADTEADDDVEVKPQQTADASTTPAAPAPPPGPSAFSDSQAPWQNPFTKLAEGMPTPDYKQALDNKRIVNDAEIRAVQGQTGKMAADNQRLGNMAEAKNAQIQAVDPNQMTTWDAKAKQAQYSTSPFEAFGSFAMIASLGMAAFARAPMTASLNAMAGVMNGIKEGNDQAYDRDYASWKENNNVFQKRFDVMKSQLSSDMDLWKTKGAMGKEDLSNTLLKYGLYKQKALLDAGLDDVLMESLTKQADAVSKMATASEKIEDQHALVEAVKGEQARRTTAGLPAMTPDETLQFKSDATRAATPEQRIQQQEWKKYSNSPEYLAMNPTEKAASWVKFRDGEGKGATATNDLYEKGVEEFKASHDGREPTFDEQVAIRQKAKAFKGESGAATRKNDLYAKAMDEAVAANGGKPLDAAQIKNVQNNVDRKAMTEGARVKLASNIEMAKLSMDEINRVERILAKHGFIAGIGGSIRRPLETITNKTFMSDATAAHDFEQAIQLLRQWEPRLITGSNGRPLSAEESRVTKIVPGLGPGDTVQNIVSRMRELKSVLGKLQGEWTSLYKGNYDPDSRMTPPVMGGSPGQPATGSTPLWMTGRPN